MVDGRPGDKDIKGWITVARLVDQNAHADRQFEAFHAIRPRPPTLPAPPVKPPVRWVPAPLPAPTAALVPRGPVPWAPAAAPPAKIPMGVPMDINAARRKGGVPPSVCRRCGKPEHWARSCPKGLNVRYLSADKWDMLIMELLAVKDAAGVPSPEVMERTSEDGEEGVPEDF